MGLRIAHHLQPVLHLPVGAIVAGQFPGRLVGDPALPGQCGQPAHGVALAQVGIAPAGDQLPGLGKELDLPDAARPQLQVAPLKRGATVKPLVIADAQAHVVGVLDGGEVQMPPPDEGRQPLKVPFARRDVARRGARLDIGRAFPGAALRLVVLFSRPHRDADRRDRGVGTQPQVGTKDIALGRHVRQHRGHPPHHADEGGPRVLHVVGVIAGFVEQADQVDVGGIVQLCRAGLAHRDGHKPPRRRHIAGHGPRKLAAPDLVADKRGHGARYGNVRQPRQRPGHLLQLPDAAQIGQGRQKRDPRLGLPQRGSKRLAPHSLAQGQRIGQRVFGTARKGCLDPVGLARHQARKIGAASGRPFHKRAQFRRKAREPRARFLGPGGVMGDGTAGQARCEGHGPHSSGGRGTVNGRPAPRRALHLPPRHGIAGRDARGKDR